MENTFSSTTMTPIIRVLRKESTRVLSLLMLDDNRNNMMFKILSLVVYCIMEKYACVDYLICLQTKLHVYF